MAISFQLDRTAEGGGRRGRLMLPHGVVETPVFMPVGTAASVKAVPQSLLEEIGADGMGAPVYELGTAHADRLGWISGLQFEQAEEDYAGGGGVSLASGREQKF